MREKKFSQEVLLGCTRKYHPGKVPWTLFFIIILSIAYTSFIYIGNNINSCNRGRLYTTHSRESDHSTDVLGVTGSIPVLHQIRTFKGTWRFSGDILKPQKNHHVESKGSKWAVCTTISQISEAIVEVARLPDWKVVVVGDVKTPYPENLSEDIYFLSMQDQEKFHTEVGTFVNKVPLNHFGRKNIGYLYAILNGANQIFDFDDDNFLKTGNSLSTAASSIMEMHVKQECLVGNPYPLMGAPFAGNVPAWPRGYPLEKIKSNCSEYVQRFKRDKSILSVFQFLADVDPDVDGIFRLTRDIPFSFNSNSKDVIAVSPGLFVPFNAQATVFKYSSFWSLFLPTTVHGRVSDIWRSYIGQRVLWEFGSQIAFLPPGVDQIRNFHYPLADMNAEKDLYEKAMSLIELLADWVPSATSVAGMLEDLYIVLYEHDVIEIQDVSLLQEWLLALYAINYSFPVK